MRRNLRQEQVRRGFNKRSTRSTHKVGKFMLYRIMESRAAMTGTHEQGQGVPRRAKLSKVLIVLEEEGPITHRGNCSHHMRVLDPKKNRNRRRELLRTERGSG
jgi:hypothetical protein